MLGSTSHTCLPISAKYPTTKPQSRVCSGPRLPCVVTHLLTGRNRVRRRQQRGEQRGQGAVVQPQQARQDVQRDAVSEQRFARRQQRRGDVRQPELPPFRVAGGGCGSGNKRALRERIM